MNSNTSSEIFGNVPNATSENLQPIPNHSETNFVLIRKPSERKPTHTLTVREAARIFEEHEVSITEHTITVTAQPGARTVRPDRTAWMAW